MTIKRKQWKQGAPQSGAVTALVNAGIPTLAALVLCARGYDTPDAAQAFLSTTAAPLHDPFLLRDMDLAVARVQQALDRQEYIAIYGDYDVDGITATSLLTRFLHSRGGRVCAYIPDRIEEGYGLNQEALAGLAEKGVTLVITVDCGITAVEEVAYAASLGVDVVITDHHACKSELPAAAAVVDPHRPDCTYPFPALAGVGVALKLALAMTPEDQREDVFLDHCELAAIGTVADVMDLTDENRVIVRRGLDRLNHTQQPGLQALLRETGVENKYPTAACVGFTFAPRINAAGRMGHVELAADLLMANDPGIAEVLARELCALNRERQNIERRIYEDCQWQLERESAGPRRVIVLAGEDWHQGVVGIVASRLAEQYACPVFMICLQSGKGKGSCRSFGGFNLFQALEQCQDLLEGFGGHAQAAGFTILEENVAQFRQRMEQCVTGWSGGAELVSVVPVDAELPSMELLTLQEVDGLQVLEPVGAGNTKPIFSLMGCTVCSACEVGGGRHLKLRLGRDGYSVDAIFFSATLAGVGISIGDRVDVVFTPQINVFRGNRTVQLLVCDVRPALTRMESELALYQRLRQGEPLSACEAKNMCPSRVEFVAVWRYLIAHAKQDRLEDTARHLAKCVGKNYGIRESVMRTMVCLEVLSELGLILLEQNTDHLCITLQKKDGKADLEQASLMRRLRKLANSG